MNNGKSRFPFWIRIVIPLAIALLIWFIPSPDGVSLQAWHLFAIFMATIVGIILEPFPMGAVALCSIASLTLTHTLELAGTLSGFSNKIVWLVVIAFFLSRGFVETGLGARIAYTFMKIIGKVGRQDLHCRPFQLSMRRECCSKLGTQ